MFDIDLLIALGFMALLFLRHVAILKKPNKLKSKVKEVLKNLD